MSGKELYDLVLQKPWCVNVGMTPPMWITWQAVPPDTKQLWNEVAAKITTTIAQRDVINPVTDDELVSWVEQQKPAILKRLYQYLNRLGYRI